MTNHEKLILKTAIQTVVESIKGRIKTEKFKGELNAELYSVMDFWGQIEVEDNTLQVSE